MKDRQDLAALLLITGVAWSLFVMLHIFNSALDGFQRFDLTTRSWVVMLFIRCAGSVAVLAMGYGLRALGVVYMLSQATAYVMNFFSFRRAFGKLRIAPWRYASRPMLREMVRYGVPSFGANLSNMLLNQSAPLG